MKKIIYLILIAVVFISVSCEPTYKKEYSTAYPFAGDWTLTSYKGAAKDFGPFEVKIYNTSLSKDSVWIDDYATTSSNGHYWSFKFRAKIDIVNKTITAKAEKNQIAGYAIPINLTNGKVVGTDSITMDVVFGDDSTTTYRIAGHRTTSYEEYMKQ